MRRFWQSTLLLGFFVPTFAFAAVTNFTGPIIPTGTLQTCAAGFGGLTQIVGGALGIMISLGVLISVMVLAYGGFLLVLNPINAENRSKARTVLLNAAIGLVLTLAAWLLINTLLTVLGVGGIAGATTKIFTGSNNPCLPTVTQKTINGGGGSTTPNGAGATGSGGSTPGSGSCQVQTSGACASSNMSPFGSQADNASEICFKESSGNAQSEGDMIVGGVSNGQPVSFGLFQINVSANRMGSLNCPTAFDSVFTGSHKNVVITNQSLYSQCKAAGEDPNQNIAEAVSISSNGSNWKPWSSAKACGLALTLFPSFALGQICSYNQYL